MQESADAMCTLRHTNFWGVFEMVFFTDAMEKSTINKLYIDSVQLILHGALYRHDNYASSSLS